MKCSTCAEEKGPDKFPKGKKQCKACAAAKKKLYRKANRERIVDSNRAWRAANPDYQRDWHAANPEKGVTYSRDWYAANPEKAVECGRAWKRANPEKIRAQVAAQRAVKKGLLVRQPCEVCGSSKVDAHHDSYDKDKQLDVRWLCHKHHKQHHREERSNEQK